MILKANAITTSLSIEKLLEHQKQQELLEKFLVAPSTTATITTTNTTPRPTESGLCHSESDLADTIRIVDEVNCVPEMLEHNTSK
ncbi:uncharacterized protein LOC131438109 isoform X2 [Malaya genurostris]|uniref:uncharacterized protein LOC131438109 isoform X2 n=1 Tax=Malaya genurostris TaxID=325434 RepID=UPI0026F3A323|nr:uncharacterized protein LOC131438109 isoform X2 [Malaya genurostris]